MSENSAAPLERVRVAEVAAGISVVGAGMAASLPGRILRDFGAEVISVQLPRRLSLDEGVPFGVSWDRGKQIVEVDEEHAAPTVAALARDADVVFLAGSEGSVERRQLGYRELASANPGLVYVRLRPSYNGSGMTDDFELLVQARSGLLTQFPGHRPGPTFCDLAVGSAGAALSATVGALARLYEREATGLGGWVETTLYDGMLAILPMLIGRVEHPSPSTASLWETLGPSIGLSFRCADGEYVQLWFGAKGAYEAFLEHVGDPPSEAGYAADTFSGAITERSIRWAERFATRDRAWWVQNLAGYDFRCEPVFRPGEVLRDRHVREIGLSVSHDDADWGMITALGPVCRVSRVHQQGPGGGNDSRRESAPSSEESARLLSGVHVLDLSAYGAGPMAARILAELAAEVVKIEPPTGDAHRGLEPMFATVHQRKRSVTVDLKSPGAAAVLQRLFEWSDVVHHSSRVGLAERLGYDEESVRGVNPNVVYSHATGFGPNGPRSNLPANDYLMQALAGIEAAAGGEGQPPVLVSGAPVDFTNGWITASAILAGLYARRRTGAGQTVTTSLLGAAMTLKSGAFLVGESPVQGPILDDRQTGYGAVYRIYQGRDGAWFALAVPDSLAWDRLREVLQVGKLPSRPPALRTRRGERQPAEDILERAFATNHAARWVADLRAAGVPAELVVECDRADFIAGILDDPVNRQLGRVVSFEWGPRGRLEQPALPIRLGPSPQPAERSFIPDLGEHTGEILSVLNLDAEPRASLIATHSVAAD